LGVATLATVVLRPTGFAATHLTIAVHARRDRRALHGTLGLALMVGIVVCVVCLLVLMVLGAPIAQALQSQSTAPIVLLAPLLGVGAALQMTNGVLSGVQRFSILAVVTVVDAAIRLVATGPLALALGVAGSLVAYVVGQLAAIGLGIAMLGGVAWRMPHVHETRAGLRTGFATMSLLAGIALLQTGDLVLLRTYAPPDDAGLYAACASLGLLFVTATAPLYLPAFPRALGAYREQGDTRSILIGVLAPIAAAGVAAILLSVWLGDLVVVLVFGASFAAAGPILPIYMAKIVALVIAGVLGQHAVATGRALAVHVVPLPALLGLAALVVIRPGPFETAVFALLASCLLVLVLVAASVAVRPRPPAAL
jgi:O-antigen/teichoic acid export membrane protein